MEITPNIADGIINNSKEAQKIFFENTKKFISFKPFVINFHKDDNDFVSSKVKPTLVSESVFE